MDSGQCMRFDVSLDSYAGLSTSYPSKPVMIDSGRCATLIVQSSMKAPYRFAVYVVRLL